MSLHSFRRCLITVTFSIFPFSLFVHQFTPSFIKIKGMLNSLWKVSVNQAFVAWPWGDKHLFLTPWTVHDCVSDREKNERIRDHGHLVPSHDPQFCRPPQNTTHSQWGAPPFSYEGREALSIDGHCAMPDHIHGGLLCSMSTRDILFLVLR